MDLPKGTKIFVNESLYPYYLRILNKSNKFRDTQNVHQYYTINGLTHLRTVESDQAKITTHMVELQNFSPISKLIVCTSIFFLMYAGEVSVVFYFLESFVVLYHIFANYFCFTFSANDDF